MNAFPSKSMKVQVFDGMTLASSASKYSTRRVVLNLNEYVLLILCSRNVAMTYDELEAFRSPPARLRMASELVGKPLERDVSAFVFAFVERLDECVVFVEFLDVGKPDGFEKDLMPINDFGQSVALCVSHVKPYLFPRSLIQNSPRLELIEIAHGVDVWHSPLVACVSDAFGFFVVSQVTPEPCDALLVKSCDEMAALFSNLMRVVVINLSTEHRADACDESVVSILENLIAFRLSNCSPYLVSCCSCSMSPESHDLLDAHFLEFFFGESVHSELLTLGISWGFHPFEILFFLDVIFLTSCEHSISSFDDCQHNYTKAFYCVYHRYIDAFILTLTPPFVHVHARCYVGAEKQAPTTHPLAMPLTRSHRAESRVNLYTGKAPNPQTNKAEE